MCSHPEPPSHLPPHPIPQGHPSAPALSTLSHASNLDWRSVSHMITYMFQCYSLKSSHPRLLPQSPKDCSIHLCLFCCLENRVIVTIFLNSLYMCQYTVHQYTLKSTFIQTFCSHPHRCSPGYWEDLPGGSEGRESACSVEDPGLIPGLGRYLGEGNGCPLQNSCLENSMDRGAWWATIHAVAESDMTHRQTLHTSPLQSWVVRTPHFLERVLQDWCSSGFWATWSQFLYRKGWITVLRVGMMGGMMTAVNPTTQVEKLRFRVSNVTGAQWWSWDQMPLSNLPRAVISPILHCLWHKAHFVF